MCIRDSFFRHSTIRYGLNLDFQSCLDWFLSLIHLKFPLPNGIEDPSRPVEGPLRVWLKVLFGLRNEVFRSRVSCTGYPYHEGALIRVRRYFSLFSAGNCAVLGSTLPSLIPPCSGGGKHRMDQNLRTGFASSSPTSPSNGKPMGHGKRMRHDR